MNFEQFNLDPRLNTAIKAVGYTTPTPIQQQAIPVVLQGKDVLGLAQTGTGKTAAFILPILQRLLTGPTRQTRALIVAPTRELAEQIYQTTIGLSRQTKIRSTAIYGGVGKGPQVAAAQRGTEIIIACPGRLLDLINERQVDLSKVEVLVLDEADRMCDMGFLPDIRRLLRYVPAQRQTLFFSATMPEDIRVLANDILKNPTRVQVDIIAPAKTVSHALFPVNDNLKTKLAMTMLETMGMGRVLIFTRTKHRARNLAGHLIKQGYRASALQGNMSQNKRQEALNGFKEGKYDILVATDIAARGIDVTEISHVINFDMPDTVDAYTHRIGRTGRAQQTGEAFTFTSPADEPMVRDIERVLGGKIERRRLPDFDYTSAPPPVQLPQRQHNAPRPQTSHHGQSHNNSYGSRPPSRPGQTRNPAQRPSDRS